METKRGKNGKRIIRLRISSKPKTKGIVVKCRITKGMFSNERAVIIHLLNGQVATVFVDKRDVNPNKELEFGQEIAGVVRVNVISFKGKEAIIELPQPSIAQGSRLVVSAPMLEEAPT